MSDDAASAFVVPGPGPYLASHAVGCPTRAALAALQSQFVEPWVASGLDAWPRWLGSVDEFRAALAAILGDEGANYCPQPSLSAGLHALLGSLPQPTGQRRVWLAAEATFPSLGFVLQKAEALGYQLRLIPRTENPADPQVWDKWIDVDTAGVLAMHVHSNTGVVSPVAAITHRCREVGAVSVIDVAQSAGIVPFSMAEFGADAVIGSCIKWLCGGPGAAFLWVRAGLVNELEPTAIGWFSHANPFEMDISSFRYASGALRFWGGTPSVAPYVMAAASARVIAQIGVAAVYAHNRALVSAFREQLPHDWRARIDPARMGGTICLDAGAHFEAMRTAIAATGARFDARGTTLRLSFHVFNTLDQARLTGRACASAAR